MFKAHLLLILFLISSFSISVHAQRFKIPPRDKSFLKYGQAEETGLNPEHFDVVIWNILKAKKKRFSKEFASFGLKTDLFLLQEVSIVGEFFNAYLPYSAHEIHFGASFSSNKKGNVILSGTAISSNTKPVASGMLRSRELEPFVKTPKVVTWMKVPFKGLNTTLLLVNIHGLNLTKNRDFFKQMDECAKIINAHNGPVIFAGDFNTSDLEKYNKMNQVALDLNLSPVAFLNDKRKKSKFSRLVIDHTFVRGLRVKTARVHTELKGSDHKAMSLVLSLP